jgi:hypothetical protein
VRNFFVVGAQFFIVGAQFFLVSAQFFFVGAQFFLVGAQLLGTKPTVSLCTKKVFTIAHETDMTRCFNKILFILK